MLPHVWFCYLFVRSIGCYTIVMPNSLPKLGKKRVNTIAQRKGSKRKNSEHNHVITAEKMCFFNTRKDALLVCLFWLSEDKRFVCSDTSTLN